MRKKLTLFGTIVFVLVAVLLLAACAAPAPAPASQPAEQPAAAEEAAPSASESSEPVELVIWGEGITAGQLELDPAADPKAEYAHKLVDGFMEENPDILVKFENHGWDEELRQNLTNALLAGTSPCIIVGEGFFKNFAALDSLVPLNDKVSDEILENAVPGTYQGAELKDEIYGLASFTSVFGFERNCSVVEAAGLDCESPPATWNELLDQAKQITEAGNGEYYGYTLQGPAGFSMGAPFRIYVYLLQAGASMSKPDEETGLDVPYFNDPKAVPVYEFLRELAQYTPPGLLFEADEGKVYTQLFQGKSAYQMAGGWHVQWAQDSGCTDCRYSSVPLPEDGEPATVVVANVIYGILDTCDQPEAALKWLEYTQRDDVQSLVFQANGRIPTTYTALDAMRPEADPATQAYIDTLLNSTNVNAMPQWIKNPQKVWQVYNDFLIKLFTTDEPVQDLMDEAQQAAEKAIQ